ncbi:MAG: D-alanyl-D-alanine carboxypeptidase family protein [Melioribacteraceae bacterium]|nr:D-alanyl-D-alanine carboxypeptidase family protein [Melioribacteraceae bacterium]
MFKAIVYISVVLLIIFSGTAACYYFQKPDYNELNLVHKYVADKVTEKFETKIQSTPKFQHSIIDYNELFAELNYIEQAFAETILSINPDSLGFKGPFYSVERPEDLIMQESTSFIYNGETIETGTQYCPRHIFEDFQKMNNEMYQAIGKTLYIDSGYRSPGRQAYLFFKYLVSSSNYSLLENARWIAMPGYSEHAHPINTALDFINQDGINGMNEGQKSEDFERLPEYKWLLENASRFNLYLTYVKDNDLGVNFEPWHWHWEKRVD